MSRYIEAQLLFLIKLGYRLHFPLPLGMHQAVACFPFYISLKSFYVMQAWKKENKERSRRLTQKIEVGRLSCTLCTNPLPPSAFPLHPALPLQLTQVLCVRTGFHFRSEQIRHKYRDNPSTDFILFKPNKCFHMVLQ